MMAWIRTTIDLALLGLGYFGTAWLLDGDTSQAGFALCVATFTLIKTYKDNEA